MQQECTKTERALCEIRMIKFSIISLKINFILIEIDHCFENNQCGIHGVCKNTEGTFQCECTFLYDGIYCDTCM